MDFLQKGKFIMELLPEKFVLEVARRMQCSQFAKLFRSSKWVSELIGDYSVNSHLKFRINGGNWMVNRLTMENDPDLIEFRKLMKEKELFYLREIRLVNFKERAISFKEVLKIIGEYKILFERLDLTSSPFIQDVFTVFKSIKNLTVNTVSMPFPLQLPSELMKVTVITIPSGENVKNLMKALVGTKITVDWNDFSREGTSETIMECLQQLKIKECRSNITIVYLFYEAFYDPHFALSEISPTVYVFRSMARGRGGEWRYFIRLEKSIFQGAVGVAIYKEEEMEGKQYSSKQCQCEYFSTMESFLDYFEREVGAKRRARDWMQLEENDKTFEAWDEDFEELRSVVTMGVPYIHFNEQKEADDFDEIRRRFFS